MASFAHTSSSLLLVLISLVLSGSVVVTNAGTMYQEINMTWGNGRGKIVNRGNLLVLSLDNSSGSGFESKNEYLFGKIDMQIKLVSGDSAGTVTAYFLKSLAGSNWDEVDFEFLGNVSGDPYTVHTNVYTQGKGNREQQFRLWFDPAKNFHTYSILWNRKTIIFLVDGIPIREFRNFESEGVPFPNTKPMRIHSSIWNADEWATRGGLVKTNWTLAPFIAHYRNYKADACIWSRGRSSCPSNTAWMRQELDELNQKKLKWVQNNFMIYNYCTDAKRFPQGFPPECRLQSN
ncbi:hypothetical protein K2173_016135 [Erythroxylum novogranatense]|uniref:Xyloglucan endotransglucosylase/hydrolase n=1 Tax=Erythroxylum novogranatense TaxID=1862640 RepID=A0AAV8SFM5_9ROSI|nr:hypothetical protein K2173_016135 [Erythroxylum novogranatense]